MRTRASEELAGGDPSPHDHTAGDTPATLDLASTARAVTLVTAVIGRALGAP